MLILDTNVISELVRVNSSPLVMRTLRRYSSQAFATTTITEAELRSGVARLPQGRRRTEVGKAIADALEIDLRGQVLPFDRNAAAAFADLLESRQKPGRPMATFDAMIASICISVGATLVTRNTRHFQDCGIELLDPWVEN